MDQSVLDHEDVVQNNFMDDHGFMDEEEIQTLEQEEREIPEQ